MLVRRVEKKIKGNDLIQDVTKQWQRKQRQLEGQSRKSTNTAVVPLNAELVPEVAA